MSNEPVTSAYKMTADESAYLKEIAAEIVRNGNPDGDLSHELLIAHSRRQAFGYEMADMKSKRAQMAYSALTASLYVDIVAANAVADVSAQCAFIDSRGSFGGAA